MLYTLRYFDRNDQPQILCNLTDRALEQHKARVIGEGARTLMVTPHEYALTNSEVLAARHALVGAHYAKEIVEGLNCRCVGARLHGEDEVVIPGWGFELVLSFDQHGGITGYVSDTSGG